MECVFNGRLFKYENEKLFIWRDTWAGNYLKDPRYFELKGCITTGYRTVCIDGKNDYYHRIVYLLHNPEWNIHDSSRSNFIDHIDRNPLNNSIENLRVVTNQQNQFNTNALGYYWDKIKGRWKAKIKVNGKQKHLGYFDDKDDARCSYLAAKAKYHVI